MAEETVTEDVVETEVDETPEGEVEEVEEEVEETFTKKDIEKVTGALDKERAINKEKAAELKAKSVEIRELKAELKKSLESKLEDDAVKSTLADAEKRADKFRNIAVNKEAKLALTGAGAKISLSRLIKLMDLDDVEISDDGKVTGLDDVIAELKEENPEFFKSEELEEEKVVKRPAVKKPGSVDGGNKTPVAPKPLTTAERFAKLALGKN